MSLTPFIFVYGSYVHAGGDVQLAVAQTERLSPRSLKMLTHVVWTLSGNLISTDGTIATLTAQMNALANAYGVNPATGQVTGAADFQNATLYLGDGVTPTHHQLVNGNSLSGVRVTSFGWKKGDKSEYVLSRGYTITLEADFLDPTQNLLDFSETMTFRGTGGPRIIWVEALEDAPQPQTGNQQTVMRCVQAGSATGALSYPTIPDPLIPEFELPTERSLVIGPVKRLGQGLFEWQVRWSYTFEGPSLAGAPNTP